MAVSNDVLVTALQELLPGLTESWTLFHPAFDAIVSKGNKRTVNHPFVEFVVLPEGPGTVTEIINGDEHIAGGRRQSAVKGSAYGATMIYAFDVPGEDLRMANGPADVAELIVLHAERRHHLQPEGDRRAAGHARVRGTLGADLDPLRHRVEQHRQLAQPARAHHLGWR
jgi:hypothetical protein